MPCSNCGQSGHNVRTCKNVKVPKQKNKSRKEKKMNKDLEMDDIDVFYTPNTKNKNDETNKRREDIIVGIGNGEIDQTWFDENEQWSNLKDEIKNFETINAPEHYDKTKWEKKAGRKYKYDFELNYLHNEKVVKTRKIEFKNNVLSVKGCPQFVSPTNPSKYILSEQSYEELFYKNFLPQICEKYGREMPLKEEYLKQINSNKSVCLADAQSKYYRGCKKSSQYSSQEEDIEFYNFCKEVSKQSINEFFKLCELDCDTLNEYLQSSQKGKEYMMYHNGKIHHEIVDIDDYTIDPSSIIKSSPSFKGKTVSGKKINILFRWKNGAGIAFPAFQIK